MATTKKIIFILVFLLCLIAQIIPVIRSGTNIGSGIGFWGPNGHDGVWHLSLINHISNPFVINMPIFSGEILKNYHPFFDILIAYISKITAINSSLLLFQIFPIISTILYLYLSYNIGKLVTKSDKGGIILMILNTLNNSFGWVINLFRNNNFEGESLFWAMQSPSNQLNPPYVLSLVLLLSLIYILLSKKNILYVYPILILLPIIKAYSAIPAFIIFLFYVIKTKKHFNVLFLSLLFSIILFLQFNKNSSSLLIWQPFWFIRSLFESTDKLYLPRFAALAHSTIFKQTIFYLIGIPIFFIGNFAFRLLSVLKPIPKSWFSLSLITSITILSLIPLFFVQSGTSWNTIQFIYYAIFLLNIPLAYFLSHTNFIFPLIIISIQILPLIASFPQYIGKNPPAYISNNEIECLNYLRQQPPSNILTYPYDAYIKDKMQAPIPLYAYTTTSYVSAYTNQTTYLEDEMNLANSGYAWQLRRSNSEKFFKQQNQFQDRGFLLNNKIDYVYLTGIQTFKTVLDTKNLYLNLSYQNDNCQIFKVIK
ncbi:MAG: hypothetical protein WC069_02420 [Candidatus Shapirobacteria bacterium]